MVTGDLSNSLFDRESHALLESLAMERVEVEKLQGSSVWHVPDRRNILRIARF